MFAKHSPTANCPILAQAGTLSSAKQILSKIFFFLKGSVTAWHSKLFHREQVPFESKELEAPEARIYFFHQDHHYKGPAAHVSFCLIFGENFGVAP